MRVLFIARNTVQLISALLIKQEKYENDKVDIILSDGMQLSMNVFKSEKFRNVFNAVFLYNNPSYINKKKYFKDLFLFRISKIKRTKFFSENISLNYDVIGFYNYDDYLGILINKIKHKNKKIKFIKYDEGAESYYDDSMNSLSLKQKIYNLIFNIYIQKTSQIDYYLFDPDIYCGGKYNSINKINLNKKNVNELIGSFSDLITEEEQHVINGVLVFEESLDHIIDVKKYEDILYNFLSTFKGKIRVKKHPRNKINILKQDEWNINIPWELYCLLHKNDFENLTLISINSTASWIPYILGCTNINSYMLYPIMQKNMTNQFMPNYKQFMEKLVNKYPKIKLQKNE